MQSHLVGLSEIAEMAGVTRQAVTNWRKRFADFPKPAQTLQSGPVWHRAEAERWLKNKDRRARRRGLELPSRRSPRAVQRSRTLARLFAQLTEIITAEAEANPAFAAKLDAFLTPSDPA